MPKKKDNNSWYLLILILVILFLFFRGGDLLTAPETLTSPELQITPTPTASYSTCDQLCTANDFNRAYSGKSVDDCILGDTFLEYGYSGEVPLLTCCCFNHIEDERCTETDGGNVITMPGITTFDDMGYMDRCLATDVRMVHEYWCEGDTLHEDNFMCAEGSICFQTRSGGYCLPQDGYEEGDVIGGDTFGGDLGGGLGVGFPIDLSEVDVGGDCYLGIKLNTDWGYITPNECQGVIGPQGLELLFYDSSGLRWSRIDTTPHADYAEICPTNWDGQTTWHIDVGQLHPYPECIIGYDVTYEIFVCDCD